MGHVEYLVLEAEKLFGGSDFPDKKRFLEIYNEFKDFEKVDRDLNLRMHSLYFYMKLHYELSEGRIPSDYNPMILSGENTIQKYSNVKLDFVLLAEMYDNVNNNQINTRQRLIESRVDIANERLQELRKLVLSMEADRFSIEEYYGKLCVYDHDTHEYHFVEPDDDEFEWVESENE